MSKPLRATILALTLMLGAPSANAAQKIVLCTSAGINTAIQPVLYSQAAGLFEKTGVTVERLDLQDDTTAVQALVSQSCDMVYVGAGTGIVAISRGAAIHVVMSNTPWTDYLLIAQPNIKSMGMLAGQSMGISKIGALNYQAAMYALQKAGVDPGGIQFVATGGADGSRAQALMAGTISSTVVNGMYATQAMRMDPRIHSIFDVGAAFSEKFMSTAVFARDDVMRDNADGVERVVQALILASRALQSNKETAIKQAASSGLDAGVVRSVYDKIFAAKRPYYGVEGGIDRKVVQSTLDILHASGDLAVEPAFEKVVEMKFIAKAMNDLGPYKP